MAVLPRADPLFTLAIVIAAGVASAWVARRVRLPGITGQILVGVLIGPVFQAVRSARRSTGSSR